MTSGPEQMREDRRIVTALFADIVGSTAITERLDPEDARDVIGGAVALMIEHVDALGGTVKDLAGDGVLALWGAPIAHEDDAERAVLCGLRIIDVIADHGVDVLERWGLQEFSVRVGIETGRAVMGRVGGGSRVEYGATGDVLNTAARLQSHAEAGCVLVGAATRGMIEDRFTWR
jgi:class 3 adenylate cyclase